MVDLATGAISWIGGVGAGPRHVVISPDDAFLYVTLNKEGTVAKVDTASGAVVEKVATGSPPPVDGHLHRRHAPSTS